MLAAATATVWTFARREPQGSVVAVLWRAARLRAPTSSPGGIFRRPPSPQRGSRSGRQTKVPVAAAGGGGVGASASATAGPAALLPPSLPLTCWFWGGVGERTPDVPASGIASVKGAGEAGVLEGTAVPESS